MGVRGGGAPMPTERGKREVRRLLEKAEAAAIDGTRGRARELSGSRD